MELLGGQVPLSRLQGISRSVPQVSGVGRRAPGWCDFVLFACLAPEAARRCFGEAWGVGCGTTRTCDQQQQVSHSSERAGCPPCLSGAGSGHRGGVQGLVVVLRNCTPRRRDLCCALPIRWYVLPGGQLAPSRNHAGVHKTGTNAPQRSGEEAPVLVRAQARNEAKACGACILYDASRRFGGWPWAGTRTG